MRDSALKLCWSCLRASLTPTGRRRAHARQRFETSAGTTRRQLYVGVGEELMRDSALKLYPYLLQPPRLAAGRRRAHARQRFETLR